MNARERQFRIAEIRWTMENGGALTIAMKELARVLWEEVATRTGWPLRKWWRGD